MNLYWKEMITMSTARIKTHTNAEFNYKVNKRFHDKITILTPYRKAHAPVRARCNVCGYSGIHNKAGRFLRWSRIHLCPRCNRKLRHHNDIVRRRKRFSKELGSQYKLLSPINNWSIYVLRKQCGHKFWVNPYNLLHGKTQCPICHNRGKIISDYTLQSALFDHTHGQLTTNSHYRGPWHPLQVYCHRCKNYFLASPTRLQRNHWECPICQSESYMDKHIAQAKLELKTNNKLKLGGPYRGYTAKTRIYCRKCHFRFWIGNLSEFMRTPYCPLENQRRLLHSLPGTYGHNHKASRGEILTSRWLDYHNVFYIYGHITLHTPATHRLHLDFYMPKLNTAIEYDGEQHFLPAKMLSDLTPQEHLEYVQDCDKRTTAYCHRQGIHLIRIEQTHKRASTQYIKQLVKKTLDHQLLPIIRKENYKC